MNYKKMKFSILILFTASLLTTGADMLFHTRLSISAGYTINPFTWDDWDEHWNICKCEFEWISISTTQHISKCLKCENTSNAVSHDWKNLSNTQHECSDCFYVGNHTNTSISNSEHRCSGCQAINSHSVNAYQRMALAPWNGHDSMHNYTTHYHRKSCNSCNYFESQQLCSFAVLMDLSSPCTGCNGNFYTVGHYTTNWK